jgi:geranylgeranyl pyrophosphate synthase
MSKNYIQKAIDNIKEFEQSEWSDRLQQFAYFMIEREK